VRATFLLRLSELTLIECVTSKQAIAEAERNLAAKIPSALPAFGAIIDDDAVVTPDPGSSVRQRLAGQAHPKDIAILAAAVAVGADFLATFNVRHFRGSSTPLRSSSRREWYSRVSGGRSLRCSESGPRIEAGDARAAVRRGDVRGLRMKTFPPRRPGPGEFDRLPVLG